MYCPTSWATWPCTASENNLNKTLPTIASLPGNSTLYAYLQFAFAQ